jgi:hypothetical protein
MSRRAGGIVYTRHAEERVRLRRISQAMIADTLAKPDRTQIEENGNTEFIRMLNGRKVHVIAVRLTDTNQWLIKSTWIRGEEDALPFWRQVLALLSKGIGGLFTAGSTRSKRR